jgi:hypothetical protein
MHQGIWLPRFQGQGREGSIKEGSRSKEKSKDNSRDSTMANSFDRTMPSNTSVTQGILNIDYSTDHFLRNDDYSDVRRDIKSSKRNHYGG